MGEVMRLADRVTVLRDGKVVLAVARSATTASALIHAMTGRDRLDVYPPPLAPPQRAVACSVDQVSTRHLTGLDVSVRKGEILGLAGLAESGQTEFLRMFMGLEPMHCGNLLFNGSTAPSTPHAAWQAGVAYVPRERRSQGLILTRSISDNVSLPHLTDTGVFVSRRGENARIGRLAGTVQLKANHMRQSVQQLSGGNQQKVMFARALYGKPSLLLLDEPTRGVDIAARFDIYELVRQLSIDGCAVIIASSDLPELLGMCDRILVLHKGRQVTLVETVDITAASLLEKINAGG
jgi:ABC-type sugar transport system ATPase subunit